MKKWLIRLPLLLFTLLLILGLLLLAAFRLVNQTNGNLLSSGENRRYLLYVPDSYNPDIPTPLVLSLHGFSEWPAHQAHISGWNELADRYGFIVVYPSGTQIPCTGACRAGGRSLQPIQ
jgi:polyhydroxybutyrate depolymerase